MIGFVFLAGLCVGSFLNVLIYRLPRNLPVARGRSYCPKCKRKISWYDNIPLLSFVILGGKCRYCKKKISLRYPFVELVTGILFVVGYLRNLDYLGYLLISSFLVIFFIDLEHQIIPDQLIMPLIIINIIYSSIFNLQFTIYNLLPTAIISALFFYFLHFITKGKGMGLGDVKFAFLIGLVFGFPLTIGAVYLAFLTGAIVGVILILVRKVRFGQQVAFGPFLALSSILTLFFQEQFLCVLKKFF